jgi:AcrR family transcriptional regulator
MQATPATGLRDRRRLAAMHRTQQVAVDLFTERGFEAVTVEQVAAAAEVSPISVYRWFGTKEGLVLWDEYDPPLFEAIRGRLPQMRPLEAVRQGLVETLDGVYDADRHLVLARTRLVLGEPALTTAAARNSAQMAAGLATLFAAAEATEEALRHRVIAAAVVAALTEALVEWTRLGGRVPLGVLIGAALDLLGEGA